MVKAHRYNLWISTTSILTQYHPAWNALSNYDTPITRKETIDGISHLVKLLGPSAMNTPEKTHIEAEWGAAFFLIFGLKLSIWGKY